MDKTSLGNRMKGYESISKNYLMKKTPVILRLDGKAFHTFTRGFDKPFDEAIEAGMTNAMEYLAKYINTLSKYYFSDIGLRNAILDMRQQEETHIMENIIYNELIGRGYGVDVGMVEIKKPDKDGKWMRIQLEVDFIATLGSKKYYVQSALSIPDREKEIQESRSLTSINDSFKKIIVVKDHIMPRRNEEGILTIGLFDFLLKEDSLDV